MTIGLRTTTLHEPPPCMNHLLSLNCEELLATSINELELSVRAANWLLNSDIETIGDLTNKPVNQWASRAAMAKSLNEIRDLLTTLGLAIKDDDPALCPKKLQHKHWYVRVIESDEEIAPFEAIRRLAIVITNLKDVQFSQPPLTHGRGGYALHFDCREEDRPVILEALADAGFRGCF